ncbi:MAG TPA: uroporphyrinogen decarboxylase family protein [Sedimentisphaerales bacterium]|nr:uroporphyrinogen decarboxylase family protein [Sedimentisphaerales bacterium]
MESGAFTNNPMLPVDVVLAPAWWFHNEGLTFDEDFFYDPVRRVEAERKMEQALYARWGQYGLGEDRDKDLPVVGAVHLAAGFLLSEMLGCKVEYKEDAPPQVQCAKMDNLNVSAEAAFESAAYKKFVRLTESLKAKYGYLTGDVNWGGILNIGLDLRGEALFMDMFDKPEEVRQFLGEIAKVIERFTQGLQKGTGSTSISVNRNVRHLEPAVFLHSECSHTMISVEDYKKFLWAFDERWSKKYRPFGIHFCGKDPDRYGEAFAELGRVDFLDVGWGGDVAKLRRSLANTFLNIRLSPVEIIEQSTSEIEASIRQLVDDSGNPRLTGVCCINIDEKVTDDKITCIFETVAALREEYSR